MGDPQAKSQHGCVIVLDDCGVLLLGPSGSGKSRLGHLLVDHWTRQDRYARWVADDRYLTEAVGGKLIAASPEPIIGLAERRYLGIQSVAWQSRAVLDLGVQLVARDELERMPDSEQLWHAPTGDGLPLIAVPNDSMEQAVELVEAHLRQKGRS